MQRLSQRAKRRSRNPSRVIMRKAELCAHFQVDDIYATCQRLVDNGVLINRPPRDGRMAFVRSPDGIGVVLLQRGEALAPSDPRQNMDNIGNVVTCLHH